MADITLNKLKEKYRNIPDFPQPGIQFKDLTTILQDKEYYHFLIEHLTKLYSNKGITKVVGVESRGFIIGGALAYNLGAGFVPIRKPGKLPFDKYTVRYDLEYGTDVVEIHTDALQSNDKVLLHDDLLATGGTARASVELIEKMGVTSIELSFIAELDFIPGRKKIGDKYPIHSIIHF